MRKVIKIFLSVISSLILVAIIVPTVIALTLFIPPVQNWAVKYAATVASNLLETKVTLKKIHIKPFSRVTIDDFYVEDYEGDTLIFAEKIDVQVLFIELLRGSSTLGEVRITGARLNLIENEDGTTNLKKVINKMKRENSPKKKAFKLRAAALKIDNSYFKYRKYVVSEREYGVNFDDIEIVDFSMDARRISIRDDSVRLKINKIELEDKSGFIVDRLSADQVVLSGVGLFLNKLKIELPDSKINMDYLRFNTGTWAGYKEFVRDVKIESKMNDMSVSFKSIAYFAPTLRQWNTTIHNLNGVIGGSVADMYGELNGAQIGESGETNLVLNFSMRGIPDIPNTMFSLDVKQLTLSAEDIKRVIADITGKEIDESTVSKINNVGHIEMIGKFDGTFSNFDADAKLYTEEGLVELDLKLKPIMGGSTAFSGHVNVEDLALGRILSSSKIGKFSANAALDGHFGGGDLSVNTNAMLTSVEYNGYRYRDVSMNGYVENRLFKGNIGSNDPNIKFDFDGLLDFNDTIPHYDFDLDLFNADLAKLNLNNRDSISVVRGRIDATGSGTTLDDLNGKIVISNLYYINPLDTIRTEDMTIVGDNSGSSKHLSFRSSFADIDYRSRTSYMEVLRDLQSVMHYYMPTLTHGEKEQEREQITAISDVDNYSLLNINIKEANNVAGIFLPGLMIASGSRLSFMFNPEVDRLSLSASSDYIEYGNNFISNLDINTRNQGDSITLFLRTGEIYTVGLYLPNFSVIGAMRENNINATMRILDQERDFSALVGLTSTLGRDAESGIPQMFLRFTPSNVKSGGNTWDIFTRGITIDSTKVVVDRFVVNGTNQRLYVDGKMSRSKSDTLKISLSKFALSPITQLTSRLGYEMEGMATGYANLISGLKNSIMHARLNFDSVRVNSVPIPDGYFESSWDFKQERAKLMLSIDKGRDTVVMGYYRPSDGRYVADVKMDDIDLALLRPLLKETLDDIEGSATARLKMTGVRKAIKFNGQVDVKTFGAKVRYTNVPYRVENIPVAVVDNKFSFKGATVLDPYGNKAGFDMVLNLMSLSNIGYQFEVRHNNLLALNTTSKENDLFYGKVFVSGRTLIKGDKSRVDLNVTSTTTGDSHFYLPLNNQATMGVSDIITFRTPKELEVDSTDYATRKQMILARRDKQRASASKSNLNVKLHLNVTPDLDFQLLIDPRVGDILKGTGTGSLTLNVNPLNNEFLMYGDCEIQQGTYQFTIQNIISKRFAIEQGSRIVWTGDPSDAMLDVSAVYKLKASLTPILGNGDQYRRSVPVECRVMLSERLSQPNITFDVNVSATPEVETLVANELGTQENMATQFFFLLAANSFYPTANTGNIGTASSSSAMFDILANQISNIISNDRFDIGFRYKPKDDITSDEFNIDISTHLFGNRLLLEMEGNYDAGNTPSLNQDKTAQLSGDFYITWLIDKNGSLRAKGFTRTIDRFDENQGLQESGIGLYYKEDFDTFKDIRGNFKERFGGERRRAKRAARKAEKEAKRQSAVEVRQEDVEATNN